MKRDYLTPDLKNIETISGRLLQSSFAPKRREFTETDESATSSTEEWE